MFCCLDNWSDSRSAYQRQTGTNLYPGQRRQETPGYQSTGGNALQATSVGGAGGGPNDRVSGESSLTDRVPVIFSRRSFLLSTISVDPNPSLVHVAFAMFPVRYQRQW